MKSLSLIVALALTLPAWSAQAAEPAQAPKKAVSKTESTKSNNKQTQTKKAEAKPKTSKTAVKKAVEEHTPVQSATTRLTEAEQAIGKLVSTGKIQCELGATVTLTEDENNPGFFNVVSGKSRYYMYPVESRTGAIRLEDPRAGAVWLQLGNKSMLMNQRKGERVADDCKTKQQTDFAEAMKNEPQGKRLLGN